MDYHKDDLEIETSSVKPELWTWIRTVQCFSIFSVSSVSFYVSIYSTYSSSVQSCSALQDTCHVFASPYPIHIFWILHSHRQLWFLYCDLLQVKRSKRNTYTAVFFRWHTCSSSFTCWNVQAANMYQLTFLRWFWTQTKGFWACEVDRFPLASVSGSPRLSRFVWFIVPNPLLVATSSNSNSRADFAWKICSTASMRLLLQLLWVFALATHPDVPVLLLGAVWTHCSQ